ncbi:hypothetical protein EMPS_04257 [Entomortierella parvispora]|uniref:SWIM-type domain-containing protein n=1 Tax=Entomortierella parvispora TaxID=205924 RepID=A0A9P3H8C9_9FUNG|nr:hypothetical protein EMPS_04257 [Entomortierella parvispora]
MIFKHMVARVRSSRKYQGSTIITSLPGLPNFSWRLWLGTRGSCAWTLLTRQLNHCYLILRIKKACPSAYLFTLLVRDRQANCGVPVAFMVCNSESINTLRLWLKWVSDHCGINATKFMVDCSQAESEAIYQAFMTSVDIYYCTFHVAQAWERKSKELYGVKVCNDLRGPLKRIRTAETEEELARRWDSFTETYKKYDKMISYLRAWMTPEKKVKWVLYIRKDYQHTNTNNLVESWHKTLKRRHLQKRRNLRADDLVFILQGKVDIDFQDTLFKISRNLVERPLSTYDKERKSKAMGLEHTTAIQMVRLQLPAIKFDVQSFRSAATWYSIRVDRDFNLILACTCSDYRQHLLPCKHMYLVERFHESMKISYTGEPADDPEDVLVDELAIGESLEQANQDLDIFGPDLEAGIGPLLRLQLDQQRAKEQEARRAAREQAVLAEFEHNKAELKDMANQIVATVEARKGRKCTLEYLKSTVAALRNTVLEIKGLNSGNTGRTCQ